jgi:hypothetical protein
MPMSADDAPGDDWDAGLSGDLGSVTDDEWQAAHIRLVVELAASRDTATIADQFSYTWSPGSSGDRLIGDDEHDPAPAVGEYDPDDDERFTGGGFRG